MEIPKAVKNTTAGTVALMLSPLGIPQNQIDAGLVAMWSEIEGRGIRSITDAKPLDRVLTPAQTAALLGRSTKTVRELCKRGRIRAVKCGANGQRASGYSEASVRAFLAGKEAA